MNIEFLTKTNLVLISILIFFIIYYLIHIGNMYINKDKIIKINWNRITPIIITLIIIFVAVLIIRRYNIIKEALNILLFSIILAYILNPLVNYLEQRNIERVWGILLVYILIFGIIVISIISFVPKMVKEFKNFTSVFPKYMKKTSDFVDNIYEKYYDNVDNLPPLLQGIEDTLSENIVRFEKFVDENIKKITSSIFNFLSKILSLVIIPIVTFYFLKDKDYFLKKLYLTIPKKYRQDSRRLGKEIDRALGEFIRGRIIVAIFVGVSTTILLVLLKINFALLIGVIAGLIDIIPYFGPVIAIVPATFFALLDSPIKAIWVIVIFTIIQQIESNIISPKIIGEGMGIHPISIILSLIIGGGIFGILGMIFAVPVLAIIKILFSFVIGKLNKT